MNNITIKNPFEGMSDIAEYGVAPEKVFERYSIEPFQYVLKYLNEPINIFLIGRTGVGKTMILSLFDPLYQKTLFSPDYIDEKNPQYNERMKLLEVIPKEIIGIQFTLNHPYLLLNRFQGILLNEEDWIDCFGDYFGHLLLRNLILTINDLSSNDIWREHNNIEDFDIYQLDQIAKNYGENIGKKLIEFNGIQNWEELEDAVEKRINKWENSVSDNRTEKFTGPERTVDLIIPILTLKSELQIGKIISNNTRFFVLLDQYETLYEHISDSEGLIDFRPLFNSAMKTAHRGKTMIEFKIGVRPYGYKDNLKLFKSGAKLDLDKECHELLLDQLAEKYYFNFIKDLTQKCLSRSEHFNQYNTRLNDLFIDYDELKQIEQYLGKSESLIRHFSRFFKDYGKERENIIEKILKKTEEIQKKSCKVLTQTILSYRIEEFLLKKNNFDILDDFIEKELQSIKSFIANKYFDNNRKSIKDFTKYLEGSLFIISSSYRRSVKIYSGFNTLRLVSSYIVDNYIKIVSEIFNLYQLKYPDKTGPIPGEIQSEAIYNRSNNILKTIESKLPHGIKVKYFLMNLGSLFRKLQLSTLLKIPTPNWFSLKNRILELPNLTKSEIIILNELLSYGYLEEKEHKDVIMKDSSRYKYDLNKILCPYFKLSIQGHKQPPYIKGSASEFIKDLIRIEDRDINHLVNSLFKKDENFIKRITDWID